MKCEICNDTQSWCVKYYGDWVCKDCFTDEYGSISDWEELNDQAKKERELKRRAQAEEEWKDIE